MKKMMVIIHNIGLCEHKTFFGMVDGHCIKCGKAFKNCRTCYPNEFNGELKSFVSADVLEKMRLIIQSRATTEAAIKEVEAIYQSLVSIAEAGVDTVNTPIGTWKFLNNLKKQI